LQSAAKTDAIEDDPDAKRKARQERAERERAAAVRRSDELPREAGLTESFQVRAQKEQTEASAARARGAMGAADAEESFRCAYQMALATHVEHQLALTRLILSLVFLSSLLTDAIRDVMVSTARSQAVI